MLIFFSNKILLLCHIGLSKAYRSPYTADTSLPASVYAFFVFFLALLDFQLYWSIAFENRDLLK